MAFLAVLSLGNDWKPFSKEVTVYRAYCKPGTAEGKCPVAELPASRTVYRVDPGMSTVTSWSDSNEITKYTGCAIRDRENWDCANDSPFHRVMTDGSIVNTSGDLEYEVSWLKWWWIRGRSWATSQKI